MVGKGARGNTSHISAPGTGEGGGEWGCRGSGGGACLGSVSRVGGPEGQGKERRL